MITPEQLAKPGTEHAHQCALFCWAQTMGGVLHMMFAIPNGGSRGDDPKSRAIHGGRMRAEGVKPGVPDILLPVPIRRDDRVLTPAGSAWAGLFIELKRPASVGKRKGVVGADQTPFMVDLTRQGYAVAVCYGWEDARQRIINYLNGSHTNEAGSS